MTMKRFYISFFILFLFLLITKPSYSKQFKGKVLYNHNGDTITAQINDKKERIRLIGIEAHKMGQGSLAEESQLFLEKLTKNKDIIIETDTQERDQFGRLLGYIYVDNKFINAEIVKEGFAKVYTVPPNIKYSEQISKAQIEARNLGKGIWYQKSINGEENNPNKIVKDNKPYKNKFNIKRKLVHINEYSKTYHKAGCKFFNCKNCTLYLAEDVAIKKGFKKCSQEL